MASWARRDAESLQHYQYRSVYNVLKAFLLFNMIAFAGVFFYAGIDLSRAELILTSMLGNWGPEFRLFALTGHHGIVVLVFLGLHYLEYRDYQPLQKWRQKIQDSWPLWYLLAAVAL